MDEAISSILYAQEQWCYNNYNQSIVFNADGTGELRCSLDQQWIFALEFSWRILPTAPPTTPVAPNTSGRRSPQLLGQLNIEMTLARKVMRSIRDSMSPGYCRYMTEEILCDGAFCPKPYTIRIEKGDFREAWTIGMNGHQCWNYSLRYSLRLFFDKSPYPPRNEWRTPERGADGSDFWEIVEFVARREPGREGKGRAMNDPPADWSSCVVC